MAAAGAVESTRTEALRPSQIRHDVRSNVIRDVCTALESRLLRREVFLVKIGLIVWTSAGRHTLFGAAETAADASLEVLVKIEVSGARRHGQHLRNDVKVERSEERGLLDLSSGVFEESDVVVLDARVFDRRALGRADVGHTTRISIPGCARNGVRGASRNGLVQPVGLVEETVLFVERTDNAANTPVVRGAHANL